MLYHTHVRTSLLCFKAVFHTLLGTPYAIIWPSISFGRGRLGGSTFIRRMSVVSVLPGVPWLADRRRPLHHQPSTCLHIIGRFLYILMLLACAQSFMVISFHMSMPPQSASSRHILNCVFSVLCCTVFQRNTTHPPDHYHLILSTFVSSSALMPPCLAPVQQAASNACCVDLALHPHRWCFGQLPEFLPCTPYSCWYLCIRSSLHA